MHSHAHAGPHRHVFAPRSSNAVAEHEHSHDDHDHDSHDHSDDHSDDHSHAHGEHGHSHGLVDPSIVRSHAGIRAVALSRGVLGVAAGAQAPIFVLTNSVALLAEAFSVGSEAVRHVHGSAPR